MKTFNYIILTLFIAGLAACQQDESIETKKEALKSKRQELQTIKEEITKLETEISSLDPEFGKQNRKATLITTLPVGQSKFEHFVEISGSVKSRRNVLISAENMGNIQTIAVKEGSEVARGQLLLSMDTELYQRGMEQLETEYALAKTMFEKQENLWKQNIGTEVQYLQAKNRKEGLERQIANIKTQIAKSQVRAPFDGTIEEVIVKVGEMATTGTPLIRIVNHREMYVKADLSEAYIGKFKKGDKLIISFPSAGQDIQSVISSVGQVIDENNRTFTIEANLPETAFKIKPNLIAVLKIKDFEVADAKVVPSKLIQKDNTGEFVFITTGDSTASVAKKVQISRGVTYKNQTLITEGLVGNELLVNEGFKDVTDGAKVKVVNNIL
ncbi:MAG: efflux RND transporter periplasmic adaptor subunit [Cyclobacteriaceae bacterium]|nr:efflux RND transporter periplasmic adaptor subunit [Cyclobacteriaceae bacterium]